MFRVTRELEFCFGHRLVDYDGKCRNLHGHNARAEITLETDELSGMGMGVDFVQIKRIVGTWLDRELDHKMLLAKTDPLLPELLRLGMPVFAMDGNPTTENMAKLIFEFAQSQGLPVAEVTLWETPYSHATYRPAGTPDDSACGVPAHPSLARPAHGASVTPWPSSSSGNI